MITIQSVYSMIPALPAILTLRSEILDKSIVEVGEIIVKIIMTAAS